MTLSENSKDFPSASDLPVLFACQSKIHVNHGFIRDQFIQDITINDI